MIWTVIAYGVEVWEWEERKEVGSTQVRYMRWILGLDWVTPTYLVRDEGKRKLKLRTTRRAWQFEKKL